MNKKDKEIKCKKCYLKMTEGEPYMHHMDKGYYNVPKDVYYCSNRECKNWCKIIKIKIDK